MPIELYNFIWLHHPWVFGDAVCRGYYFLRDGCSYATALNIASLSAERYMAICHPFKAKSVMSRSRTKRLIGAMWLASFGLASPMLFTMGQKVRNGENICTATVSPVTMKTVLQVSARKTTLFLSGCNHSIEQLCVCVCMVPCPSTSTYDVVSEHGKWHHSLQTGLIFFFLPSCKQIYIQLDDWIPTVVFSGIGSCRQDPLAETTHSCAT